MAATIKLVTAGGTESATLESVACHGAAESASTNLGARHRATRKSAGTKPAAECMYPGKPAAAKCMCPTEPAAETTAPAAAETMTTTSAAMLKGRRPCRDQRNTEKRGREPNSDLM
jgi:hypothetical protein